MANKITTVIDFVTTGAQRSVKTFRQSISEAEGTVGKFKAGASSAMQAVQANAANLALAGGAALVAFGAKSIAAFQDTAIAAGKFSDATGLAVEDASRLQEVAGDVGVGVDSITGAITRMNQAAAKGDLEKFGVELQRAKDGTVDVNATFLETIKVLNGIADPTERALAAQKIFGKGYKEVAEIIFDSADNVAKKLGDVSNAKVIDEDELRKARQFRESMDNLHDSLEDVQLAAGEALVPLLSDLADVVTGALAAKDALEDAVGAAPGGKSFLETAFSGPRDIARDFKENARNLGEGLGLIGEKAAEARDEVDRFSDSVLAGSRAATDAEPPIDDAAEEVADLGDKAANTGAKIGDMAGVLADLPTDAEKAAEALGAVAEAAQAIGDAVDTAFSDFEDDLDQLDAIEDIKDQFKELGDTGEEGMRRLRRSIANFLRDLQGIGPDRKIEILAELRNADADRLRAILDDLTKDRFINIGINAPTPGFTSGNVNFNPSAGTVTPTFQNAIPPSNVTIIYPVGSTPTTQYIDGQTDLRRNGTRNPNIV